MDRPEFIYQIEKCSGRLWWRKCWIEVDRYDYLDPEVRKELKDKGFKLKVVR